MARPAPRAGTFAVLPVADALDERRLAQRFGANLRRLRATRGLTLGRLARAAKAPVSALARLEGGRAAPSIDVAWRLAAALDVPFAMLAAHIPARSPLSVTRAGEGELVSRERGGATRALFPLGEPSRTELYELSLKGGRTLRSDPRPPGTVEKLVLHAGELEICVEDEVVRLGVRDAVTLAADRRRVYRNPGRPPAVAFVVLVYAETHE